MRGGINFQVNTIFVKSGIFTPGVSKHAEKEIARESGARGWADLGKELKIYSYETAHTYKEVWHDFATWAKENVQLRDIEKTSSEHVKEYLESRVADGVKYSTFEKECSALAKFENALNAYSEKFERNNEYNFRDTIKEVKAEAREVLDRSIETRAYDNPKAIIENIKDDFYKTIASVQYESGARINEVWQIEKQDLHGLRQDPLTNEVKGWIEVEGKGGKEREIAVSPETYQRVYEIVERQENMHFDKDEYRGTLREAAYLSGQDYTGSHGLRWNFAQERMEELSEKTSLTYEEKLQQVSWEMGHERGDITEHYLRK
jgi:site-specific recombinase XerD